MTYRVFKDTFYYGEFEFPEGSGNWYKGAHKSLVTRQQWDSANGMLKTFEKSKWGGKSFFFGKLFKCGGCKSGVCGENHVNRFGTNYIYYKCTKYCGKITISWMAG